MKSFQDKKILKRANVFVYISFLIFMLLMIRLFWIQIVKNNEYRAAVLKQHVKEVRVAPPRGIIFDRNLVRLTNRKHNKALLLFKDTVKNDEKSLKEIKDLTGYTDLELKRILDTAGTTAEIMLEEKTSLNKISINGAILIDKENRYDENNILSHVIGYVNESDNMGISGIEKRYDDIFKQDSKYGLLTVAIDGKQRLIPGMDVSEVSKQRTSKSNSVKLTIDYEIQKAVENILDKDEKNGAVVVADVSSGDIIAMASRPNIDLTNVDNYFESKKMELYNRATELSYPPGSIFKIVVLLSALENNMINEDEKFVCNGYETVGTVTIGCNKEEGHGEIDIEQAFYDSCNSAFIQLGKRIGAKKIIETAKRIGFGSTIEIGLLETEGNLPKDDELLGPAIGNISIGQGNIETTPIQITNMMMIIVNDGIWKDLSIVDSIVTDQGRLVKKINREDSYRAFPENICKRIKIYLEDVVEKGTARNISIDDIGGGAGKTGSAQAILNQKKTVHGWFAGYFPKKEPKYVVTVFIEGGHSGSRSAAPIFEQIAKIIYDIEKHK